MVSKELSTNYKSYDYLVFTKLVRFSAFMPVPFLLIIPGTVCTGFLIPGFFMVTICVLLFYGLLLLFYLIFNQCRYHFVFKGWQQRLPFELKGWDEIIRQKKMVSDLGWNDMRLEVVVRDDSKQDAEALNAALKIFIEESGDAFYDQERGTVAMRDRRRWILVSPLAAEGSGNTEVMRYMKQFFENQLTALAKHKKIESVNVSLLSEEFEVQMAVSGD